MARRFPLSSLWMAAVKTCEKNLKNLVDNPKVLYYTTLGIEAWLSLVERCVRDAEAACSNHVASMIPLA